MNIVKFVKAHGFKALNEHFAINVREYPEGLYVLNYDQIESPKTHPVVMEARALILDGGANVVARAFDRFFNYGEVPEASADFDIATSYCLEKADGSLIRVYWCPPTGRWEIATRSTAFAEAAHPMGGTFRDWVLRAFALTETQFQDAMQACADAGWTYVMEYIGPENRVVTQYQTSEMVMLSVRNNASGEWLDFALVGNIVAALRAHGSNVRLVRVYDLGNWEDILRCSKELNGRDGEGFVVWDYVHDLRVKIKSPGYLAIHGSNANGQLSLKRIYELVLLNEHDEYLTYFESDRPFFQPAIEEVRTFLERMGTIWEGVKSIQDQREFAQRVQEFRGRSLFFEARKRGLHPVKLFHELDLEKRLWILRL
jgi:T4 RnlA family RNA ligase